MKRRILLVDDEVAVLLTLKAVLEISGFEVETAASAKEGRSKLKNREYAMVITDLRMESDAAGAEVIQAARSAAYHPAVALLTAFPVAEEDWQEMGADKMLVKPMQTKILLQQIERLLVSHESKLIQQLQASHDEELDKLIEAQEAELEHLKSRRGITAKKPAPKVKKPASKKVAAKQPVTAKTPTKAAVTEKAAPKKIAAKKLVAKKSPAKKAPAKRRVAPPMAKKVAATKTTAKKAAKKAAKSRKR